MRKQKLQKKNEERKNEDIDNVCHENHVKAFNPIAVRLRSSVEMVEKKYHILFLWCFYR